MMGSSSSRNKPPARPSTSSTPRRPVSSQPATQPAAPKKATVPTRDDNGSSYVFPTLHAVIRAFHLGPAAREGSGQQHKTDAATLGPFFPAYKAFAAIQSLPPDTSMSWSNYPLRFTQAPLRATPEASTESVASSGSVLSLRLGALHLDESPSYRPGRAAAGSPRLQPAAAGSRRPTLEPAPVLHGIQDDEGARDDPIPTRDETMITVFMTCFFNALSSFIGAKHAEHQMLPIRELFRCAPLGSTSESSAGEFYYFNAAVDALVPTIEAEMSRDKGRSNVDYLFLSEFKRDPLDDLEGTIERQETAEIAAFIATQHAAISGGKKKVLSPDNYRVLLLSQYNLDITLTLAQYDQEWLEYLLDGSKFVLGQGLQEEKHMLRIRRIGKYDVANPGKMYELVALLAAILLKDCEDQAVE
ncbi:hypothetical protein VTK73DRAFT_9870 [Phialemonium thermophilum]|uniref:Uncharacterized protein n=1 Tax=Phialemonium thermophilum TaxID=223376 RepID=A0ABR3VZQ1_9PEZI